MFSNQTYAETETAGTPHVEHKFAFHLKRIQITDAMATQELGKILEKQLLLECPGKKPPPPAPVEKPEGGEQEEIGEVDEGSSTHLPGPSKSAAGSSTDAASHAKHIGSV